MSGELDGEFAALTATEYSVDAQVDYVYYRDIIFKRPNLDTAEGEGTAFDLAATWQPSERWFLAVEAKDLFTEIRWDDVPHTVATARTARKSYDEDGYAFFNPLFSGRQGYQDEFVQQIDPRYNLNANYTRGSWSLHLEAQHQFGYGFAGLGASHGFSDGTVLKALVWPELGAVEFELQRNKWRVGLATDHVFWPRIQMLTLNLSYGY